jgi:hypothetical protein
MGREPGDRLKNQNIRPITTIANKGMITMKNRTCRWWKDALRL